MPIHQIPLGYYPFKGNLGVPTGQRKFENPTAAEVKFSLTRGDSGPNFLLRGNTQGELVYRQYCLLPAPKHILKIIISHFEKVLLHYITYTTRPTYNTVLYYVFFHFCTHTEREKKKKKETNGKERQELLTTSVLQLHIKIK